MSAVQGLGLGLTILLTGTSKESPNSLKPRSAARSFQNRALHLLLKKKPPVFDPQSDSCELLTKVRLGGP